MAAMVLMLKTANQSERFLDLVFILKLKLRRELPLEEENDILEYRIYEPNVECQIKQMMNVKFIKGLQSFWPSQGPFRGVFNYNMDHGVPEPINCIPNAAVGENQRTVEEINIELNERFYMWDHVFLAVCEFIKSYSEETQDRVIFERLVTLRDMPAMLK